MSYNKSIINNNKHNYRLKSKLYSIEKKNKGINKMCRNHDTVDIFELECSRGQYGPQANQYYTSDEEISSTDGFVSYKSDNEFSILKNNKVHYFDEFDVFESKRYQVLFNKNKTF